MEHPVVSAAYLIAMLVCVAHFRHPVLILLAFIGAGAYQIHCRGKQGICVLLGAFFLGLCYAIYYGTYYHFGETVLWENAIGNAVTLEALVKGLALGMVIAGFLLWWSILQMVMTTDRIVYLLGRIWPRLAIFFSIFLRMIPRIKVQRRKISLARQGIGRGGNQGTFFQRWRNRLTIASMTITWILESCIQTSASMENRGGRLKGRKSYSLYSFTNVDRIKCLALFACFVILSMADALERTQMSYDPRLIWPEVKGFDLLLWLLYGGLCLLPLLRDSWYEYRLKQAQKKKV